MDFCQQRRMPRAAGTGIFAGEDEIEGTGEINYEW